MQKTEWPQAIYCACLRFVSNKAGLKDCGHTDAQAVKFTTAMVLAVVCLKQYERLKFINSDNKDTGTQTLPANAQ